MKSSRMLIVGFHASTAIVGGDARQDRCLDDTHLCRGDPFHFLLTALITDYHQVVV